MDHPMEEENPMIDRRNGERTALATAARLQTPTGSHSVRTVDISADGVCMLCNTTIVKVSQKVVIAIAGYTLTGVIAWTSMDRAGMRFDRAVKEADLHAILSAPKAY